MLRDLRHLCEHFGELEADDLRMAARTILQRQFLLLERNRDREAYRLITNHFNYFTNLFDALGWTLYRDDGFSIIVYFLVRQRVLRVYGWSIALCCFV